MEISIGLPTLSPEIAAEEARLHQAFALGMLAHRDRKPMPAHIRADAALQTAWLNGRVTAINSARAVDQPQTIAERVYQLNPRAEPVARHSVHQTL